MNRDELISEIEYLFRCVFRALRKEINQLLDQLSSNEYIILKYLTEHKNVKTSDLSHEFNMSASHVTVLCDQLVKKGFLTRIRSELDRRVVELQLTQNGRELIDLLKIKKSKYLESYFGNLTTEELSTLSHFLLKLNS